MEIHTLSSIMNFICCIGLVILPKNVIVMICIHSGSLIFYAHVSTTISSLILTNNFFMNDMFHYSMNDSIWKTTVIIYVDVPAVKRHGIYTFHPMEYPPQ